MKKIAILRGGPSSEYEVSLETGKAVIEALSNIGKYKIVDVTIDKKGNWFVNGFESKPINTLRGIDSVFNAMHGEYGEDGQVQKILENLGVKFTGPTSLAANLSMNKEKAKEIFKSHGLKTPVHKVLSKPESEGGLDLQAHLIFHNLPLPVIIKPANRGSSIGVSVAKDLKSIRETLESVYNYSDKVIVEEYIQGKEATVGVIDNFRNQNLYSLLPVEISFPKQNTIFDYGAKYSDSAEKRCPGKFNMSEAIDLQEIAKLAHQALGLRHYSRTDFIVHPKRGIYILETNSLPGLTRNSLFPMSFEPLGFKYEDFLDHVIDLSDLR